MKSEFQVRTIGGRAHAVLSASSDGCVIGSTSRGIFLRASGLVVFLSFESSRGPLTLNLAGGIQTIIPSGAVFRIEAGAFEFPVQHLWINFDQAAVWDAEPPTGIALPRDERAARLRQVAASLLITEKPGSLQPVLAALAGVEKPILQAASLPYGLDTLPALRGAIAAGQAETAAALLQPFLGWGVGLTPSGDDLAAGLLLALTRWGVHLHPGLDPATLAARVLPAADQRTTTLSASLIECAARGQADERLLLALDGLVIGAPGAPEVIHALDSWGSASGGDALAGMALAF